SETYLLGQGLHSCANWLSRPEYYRDGEQWILGYWSALNVSGSSAIGSHSDGEAIIAEIKLICVAEPSTGLTTAIDRVYENFRQRGK
ncbi:MAG TPA: hypothetical protein VHX19_14495, partial [Stellaceae bacterium]|nr:hypothetical protein [Stellaceae bacterium]